MQSQISLLGQARLCFDWRNSFGGLVIAKKVKDAGLSLFWYATSGQCLARLFSMTDLELDQQQLADKASKQRSSFLNGQTGTFNWAER